MIVEKDINGVEYSYENKDELAFGTYFEDRELERLMGSVRSRRT